METVPLYEQSTAVRRAHHKYIRGAKKRLYQALYRADPDQYTSPVKRGLATFARRNASAYKETYKFIKYNPEILALADEYNGAAFEKFVETRGINYVPIVGAFKQMREYARGKQYITNRPVNQKSLAGISHITGAVASLGSQYYGLKSGIAITEFDFSNLDYAYASALWIAAKFGYISLFEELHNEYSSNRRVAQQRHFAMKKLGLKRDPGLFKRARHMLDLNRRLRDRFF